MLCSFQFDSSTAVYHALLFDCSDYYLAWFYDEYVSMLILRTVNSVQSRQLCFLKTRQPFICSDHVYRSTAMSHSARYHSKRIQIKIEMSIRKKYAIHSLVNCEFSHSLILEVAWCYLVPNENSGKFSQIILSLRLFVPDYMEKTCAN